jgi:hypothetical protein
MIASGLVLTLISSAMLLIGAVLVWKGARGRYVGDHPHCRHCTFDLYGLPAGHERCPECGSDLHVANAFTTGKWERRPRLILPGLLLLGLSLAHFGNMGLSAIGALNLNAHKPVWVLAMDATSPLAVTRTAAIAELESRLTAGTLSPSQFNGVAKAILSAQASALTPWEPQWGDLLYRGHAAGLVTPEQWTGYCTNAMPPCTFEVRKQARLGDPVPYRISHGKARVGTKMPIMASVVEGQISVAGTAVPGTVGGGFGLYANGGLGGSNRTIDPKQFSDLRPGLYPLKVKQTYALSDQLMPGAPQAARVQRGLRQCSSCSRKINRQYASSRTLP